LVLVTVRCPTCNNSAEFIARSLQQGLYIPHKDPEWEADEDFYNYRYILRILQVMK
jgi:hypothetical protein